MARQRAAPVSQRRACLCHQISAGFVNAGDLPAIEQDGVGRVALPEGQHFAADLLGTHHQRVYPAAGVRRRKLWGEHFELRGGNFDQAKRPLALKGIAQSVERMLSRKKSISSGTSPLRSRSDGIRTGTTYNL